MCTARERRGAGGFLTPAELQALVRIDRLDAVDRLVGDQLDAGVEELQARSRLRLLAALGELGHRLDAFRRHEQRILLRGRTDDAALYVLDAGATAVDRDDQ